jgi:hypothetical protein
VKRNLLVAIGSLAMSALINACSDDEGRRLTPDAAVQSNGGVDASVDLGLPQDVLPFDGLKGDGLASKDADTVGDVVEGDAAESRTLPSRVTVPGSANPWLAGLPAGATAVAEDKAPAQSPVYAATVSAGMRLVFGATGGVSFAASTPIDSPDGSLSGGAHPKENGISSITSPWNSLLGVFLGPEDPRDTPAPDSSWNFLSQRVPGNAFLTLEPGLKQVFFVGDGRTGVGIGDVQTITVPQGATRLYLGTSDGSGWYNNSGKFDVMISVAPN